MTSEYTLTMAASFGEATSPGSIAKVHFLEDSKAKLGGHRQMVRISRDIEHFLLWSDQSLSSALQRIDETKAETLYVVSSDRRLIGSLTDGDVRRWLLVTDGVSLDSPCHSAAKENCIRAGNEASLKELRHLLRVGEVKSVPLIDGGGHVVAIARLSSQFHIAGRNIGAGFPAYIVAEIGVNHDGDLSKGLRLVELSRDAGADAVKFQLRSMTDLYRSTDSAASEDLGAEYTLDLLKASNISPDETLELMQFAKEIGLESFCTPWDIPSARLLESWGVPAFKVASADLTYHGLLAFLASTGVPVIASTGMSTEHEIQEAVSVLSSGRSEIALLHCNSSYPAPYKDINLRYMKRLGELGHFPIGYSGHERGWQVALAAVAMGANILEKHITLDRRSKGVDHAVSLEPAEFVNFVSDVRIVEEALGSDAPRSLSQGEKLNRLSLAKSLVASVEIPKGTPISASMLEVRSPGRGLQPDQLTRVVGSTALRTITRGDFVFENDISLAGDSSRAYVSDIPWGLPVRFHDWQALATQSNPDFLEFHLSYRDLDLSVNDYLPARLPYSLVVHSPDLFRDELVLDLASLDASVRQRSISELQRVIDLTSHLSSRFDGVRPPLVVASLGGSTKDAPLAKSERSHRYELLASSLQELDLRDITLTAQTLPPFPWYLGGQWHCNLFVDPFETADFCRATDLPICLDSSHTKLACNHLGVSFAEGIDALAPMVRHLHLVDAHGVDGEGLQVLEGDIDWPDLMSRVHAKMPLAGFIPEIWQGHVGGGVGFWVAMARLEPYLSRSAPISKASDQ